MTPNAPAVSPSVDSLQLNVTNVGQRQYRPGRLQESFRRSEGHIEIIYNEAVLVKGIVLCNGNTQVGN
jgi:hypothetical protein